MADKIASILQNLTKSNFVAAMQHFIDTIRNQQNKHPYIVTTLTQLHLDYARQKQGLTLYLEKTAEVTTQDFPDQQKKINKENRR